MGEILYGYYERPDYEDQYLLDTVGYVTRIWVEQEGSRDQIKFSMTIHVFSAFSPTEREERTMSFVIYLDRGTTVAFAQLQLLRDALDSTVKGVARLMVQVHFTLGDRGDLTWGYAYWIRIVAGLPYPTTVQDYYSGTAIGWFTHVD